jgi:site-specific recombinase XerD
MSKKIEEVTQEFWDNEVDEINKELIEDFLSQNHLSKQTLKQYESALKIFAKWIYDHVGKDKSVIDLRPRHARKYQDWLISKGLSPSAVKFKRSAVSSLCGFIELYYDREYRDFRNIYSKAIPSVPKSNVKEKKPLTVDEIDKLVNELTNREEWQKLAYVLFTYTTGCRREEARQLLCEVSTYEKHIKKGEQKNYYLTHTIRAKGKGSEGKPRKFKFDEKAMEAIKKWIEYRKSQVSQVFGDTCPYVFVSKGKDDYRQISANTFNLWCDEFSKILGGRPVHPHLFRSSRATNAVIEEGKDIKSVQTLLGHNSSQTTEIYVVRDDSDDDDDLF